MSPARRGRPRGASTKRRRGGRGAGVAIAFLIVVAAGAGGLAMYLGFVPGPSSLLGGGGPLPEDTISTVPVAPVSDSVALAAPDSVMAQPSAEPTGVAGPVSAADSAAGETVYRGAGRCVGCHGNVGEGAPGLGSALRDSLPRSGDGSPAAIARVVTGGLPPSDRFRVAMPAYAGQLDAVDVARVAAYVFALAHPGGGAIDSVSASRPAPRPPPAADPVNADARAAPPRPTVPRPPTHP